MLFSYALLQSKVEADEVNSYIAAYYFVFCHSSMLLTSIK